MPSLTNLSPLHWRCGQTARAAFGPTPVDDMAGVSDWLPAHVPGDVRADLIAAGRIPSVDTPEGITVGRWVDDFDWWYRVTLPPLHDSSETIVLEADGIDYTSAIWLDDHLLATHAGMFSRQMILLSPLINRTGEHELRIRVWGGGALPQGEEGPLRRALRRLVERVVPGIEYFGERLAVPKAQFSFGWDFSPRLLTGGIWDEVRLISCREAYLEDVWAAAEPADDKDPTTVRWRVRLQLRPISAAPLDATISVAPLAGGSPFIFTQGIQGDTPVITFDMPQVQRWHPWDQGEPHLYRVTVQLRHGAALADERNIVTGVRTVQRECLSDGKPWRFTVNGRHVFLRGANWVPADVLPGRVTVDDYDVLIGMARRAGINFLRVWGGGVREKRAFWEACDRAGILAWQEFPLACTFLDHYPRNRRYLATLSQEARSTVRLLRNHPSLLGWCGGNEINPRRESKPLAEIKAVLAQEDPGRPWIPASPLSGDGDIHEWDVWHGAAPWTRLAGQSYAFMSEFGLQSLPHAATVAEFFAGPAPPLADPRWKERKVQIAKLRRYGGPDMDAGIDAAILASQRVQATALQAGIEACRIRRESLESGHQPPTRPCGGVAFWQFNEPWPAVTWSVVDHARRPKAAYRKLLLINQPVLIAARFARRDYRAGDAFTAEMWLVNDGAEAHEHCTAEARLDGAPVWQGEDLTLVEGSASCVGRFNVNLLRSPAELTLSLRIDETALAANSYDLRVHLSPPRGIIPWLRRRATDWLITG